MKIHIKKVDDLYIPTNATPQSSGYDVIAMDAPNIVGVKDGHYWESIDYIEYRIGLFISPQKDQYQHNYHTLVLPRSSLRNYNLALANSICLIDNDYRGEIFMCFKYIWQPCDFVIDAGIGSQHIKGRVNMEKIYKKGDKIGQLVAEVSNPIDWIVVDDLSITERGAGGFGSTDKKVYYPNLQKISESDKKKLINELVIDDGNKISTPENDVIKIRAKPPVETVDPLVKKYDVDKPFSQIGKSTIVEKWKQNVQTKDVVGYEKLVKERES